MGDLQASEDIVQETLLGAVRGIDDFDRKFTFEQYLFGICRNRTIDHMRRRKARTIQVGEDELLAAYEVQKAQYETQETRNVRHILIEAENEAALETATRLVEELRQGADFEELARETFSLAGEADSEGLVELLAHYHPSPRSYGIEDLIPDARHLILCGLAEQVDQETKRAMESHYTTLEEVLRVVNS